MACESIERNDLGCRELAFDIDMSGSLFAVERRCYENK
mgnify:CR=1 FL=1